MNSSKFSFIFFIFSSVFLVFNGGYLAREFKLFPYQLYTEAVKGWSEIRAQKSEKLPWFYERSKKLPSEEIKNISQTQPGLSLVTEIAAERNISAKIIDLEGNTVHQWAIDWFEMWPNPQHLPKNLVPQAKPGTNIHGAVVMKNGDLIFNFESKGLIRIDRDGEVVWRLAYLTHHSIHQHDDGNLWISGTRYQTEKVARLPHLIPPFYEETILEISPQGKILREWYIADILRQNGYKGLLYMGSLNNENTSIKGDNRILGNTDLLHLNDVEPFSAKLQPGFFQLGDVMVSLRNVNTVFVFNIGSEKIKFISIGKFVRQHDPDFIDGDTFSVFDNNNASEPERNSKITIVSAKDNSHKVFFAGSKENKFFTRVMGKHQWQPNGNLLITESMSGRGFEVDRQGNVVWEYVNYVEPGIVGVVGEVQRLSPEYTELFTLEQ
ncbi:arylsulfotransferase family protein [Pleurocapsa sp. PCC 7319]|uniref:arylsulfotransferase family protein n=1 Tax=Pleurocapsa sp. PCC 7319 TaxID=118161 RepID=UPI00034B03E5|nr:arylsulfotransferase family protein [Pleurocapsa sp. PCC 7319]